MNLKSFFVITAVLGLALGLGFFCTPELMMSTFGISAGEAHQHTARNFGSAVIALAVISWMARDATDSRARRAIILGLFTYFVFGSISIISFQLQGNANIYGWFIIVLHVILAFAFGYSLLVNRSSVDR